MLKTPRSLLLINLNSLYLDSNIYRSIYKEIITTRYLRLARDSEYLVRSLIKIIVNNTNILYSDKKDYYQKDNKVLSC